MRHVASIFLIAALAACSNTALHQPGYLPASAVPAKPEPMAVPSTWRHAETTDAISSDPWWSSWRDESIGSLVRQAMLTNPEIRIAETRSEEIVKIAANADPDEKIVAQAAVDTARNDVLAARQVVTHAVVTTYIEARMNESRLVLLGARLQLEQELIATLRKRLAAGLANAASLQDQAQAASEMRQSLADIQHEHDQTVIRLALLLGQSPVDFSLSAGQNPPPTDLKAPVDAPGKMLARRLDVQSAWQRLLAASASPAENNDDASIAAQIEQSETLPLVHDRLYRKIVLTAMQDTELAMASWRASDLALTDAQEMLKRQSIQVADTLRAVDAGRLSKVELLKARLAENIVQENVLTAAHAKNLAYAALQLAIAHQ